IGINLQQLGKQASALGKDYSKDVAAFGDTIEKAFEQGGDSAGKLALQAALATTSLGPVSTALIGTGQSMESFARALTGSDAGWKLFVQNAVDADVRMGNTRGGAQHLGEQLQQLRQAFLNGK